MARSELTLSPDPDRCIVIPIITHDVVNEGKHDEVIITRANGQVIKKLYAYGPITRFFVWLFH